MNLLSLLPLNKTTLEVLLELYAVKEDYLRNLEKKTKINPSLLHRILKKLLAARAVVMKRKGKEMYYSLSSEDYPFWVMVLEQYHRDKVMAAHHTITALFKLLVENREMLNDCRRIYLFGSFIEGKVTPGSDIDLLFVTSHKDKVMLWCREASIILQREINPLIYTPLAYKRDLKKNEAFLNSVIKKIKNRITLK